MATLTCMECGRRVRKRVVYGYPTPETLELAKAGKVVLGGCCLPAEPILNWRCDTCRAASDDPADPGARTSSDTERRQSP